MTPIRFFLSLAYLVVSFVAWAFVGMDPSPLTALTAGIASGTACYLIYDRDEYRK